MIFLNLCSVRSLFDAKYFFNLPVAITVLLTFLNDVYFKVWAQLTPWNLITGKISDFCGLFFFPVLVVFLVNKFFRVPFRIRLIQISCVGTIGAFIFFKFVPIFRDSLIHFFQNYIFPIQITNDPTDIVSVISVFLAYKFLTKFLIVVE